MIGHAAARQLTDRQLQEILRLSKIGSSPRNILAGLSKQRRKDQGTKSGDREESPPDTCKESGEEL
jgi:hypothetical protein